MFAVCCFCSSLLPHLMRTPEPGHRRTLRTIIPSGLAWVHGIHNPRPHRRNQPQDESSDYVPIAPLRCIQSRSRETDELHQLGRPRLPRHPFLRRLRPAVRTYILPQSLARGVGSDGQEEHQEHDDAVHELRFAVEHVKVARLAACVLTRRRRRRHGGAWGGLVFISGSVERQRIVGYPSSICGYL